MTRGEAKTLLRQNNRLSNMMHWLLFSTSSLPSISSPLTGLLTDGLKRLYQSTLESDMMLFVDPLFLLLEFFSVIVIRSACCCCGVGTWFWWNIEWNGEDYHWDWDCLAIVCPSIDGSIISWPKRQIEIVSMSFRLMDSSWSSTKHITILSPAWGRDFFSASAIPGNVP